MVTISARTFRYSRRDDELNYTRYHFVDQHGFYRKWTLVHWHGTPLWQGIKRDERPNGDIHGHRVILPAQLQHALMAALVRHRRIVAATK